MKIAYLLLCLLVGFSVVAEESVRAYKSSKLILANTPEALENLESIFSQISDDEFLKFIGTMQVLTESYGDNLPAVLNDKTLQQLQEIAEKQDKDFATRLEEIQTAYTPKQLKLLRNSMLLLLRKYLKKSTEEELDKTPSKVINQKFEASTKEGMQKSLKTMLNDMTDYELAQFAFAISIIMQELNAVNTDFAKEQICLDYFDNKTFGEFIATFRQKHGEKEFDLAIKQMCNGLTAKDYLSLREELQEAF